MGYALGMRRRDFLGSIAGAAGLGAAERRPNVLFILADDLGYGDLGCYGQKRIQTPNIDRLAKEGLRFTDAHSGATVCAPSRCCLMTGKHTGHSTVRGNMRPEVPLTAGEHTLGSVMKSAGYRTGVIGKWGLGGPHTESIPSKKGFDEFFGYLNHWHAHLSYPDYIWDGQQEMQLPENWFHRQKVFSNDLFTERALSFVERNAADPFFLYLPYTIPHANNELGQMQPNGMEVPDKGIYAKENWPDVEKNFAAAITRMDGDIGKIVALLEKKGVLDNTLIFFTSDNGAHKEGGHDPKFFASSGPLRGTKRDLYEGGIRVPAIAQWKGKIAAGTVSDFTWAFWDVLPTLAEIGGVPAPAGIDGMSIAPALMGKKQMAHEYLYWEFHERGFHQAVRQGNWKLVRQGPKFETELFDLSKDLSEQDSVASKFPDVAKRLEGLLGSARTESVHWPVKKI